VRPVTGRPPHRRPAALAVAAIAAAAALAGCDPAPIRILPPANEPLLAEHRRLVEEGQRASRLLPAAPRAQWQTAGSPIVQIPIVPAPPWSPPTTVSAQPPPCPYNPAAAPAEKTASLMMDFGEVAWHVCVSDMRRASLWIGPVHIRRGPGMTWDLVILRAGLAEIFVPYHSSNFRPYDLQATFQLDPVGVQDLGQVGSLVQLTNEPTYPTVAAEIRDRGLAWFCASPTASGLRRARELVIWGVADGGNYDNVVEYAFRDDGAITFRLGNTGYNSPNRPVEPHTHNALWYVDTELTPALSPPLGETAYWLTHAEPSPANAPNRAADARFQFTTEGWAQWDPMEFGTLLVEDGVTNAAGSPIGYEFAPLQNARARHYGVGETWTWHDVYVTRARASELGWIANWTRPENYLIPYLNHEPAVGEDLAVWIKTAAHHHPNDEDRSAADLNTTATTGVTLMHWSGFIMQPHNLFAANPLGGPVRCGN